MNICDVLVAEYRFPGRHRTPAMEHGFPKCPLILENAAACQLRPHQSHGTLTMTGLTIVRINSRSPGGDTGERTDSHRLLSERL